MITRRLTKDNDWTFGNGKANYLKDNEAVLQNVTTRIRSFKYDWFLDEDANIDWFSILGSRDNKQTILDEVKRVTLQTDGVTKVNKITILETDKRGANIEMELETIYKILNKFEVTI